MDERRHFTTIADVARQIAESHRLYDSAFRSLTASTAMDAALKALAEHAAFEKASIASITSSLSELSKLGTLFSSIRALTEANASIKSIFESTRSIDSAMRSVLEHQRQWQEMTKNLGLSSQLAELTLRRHRKRGGRWFKRKLLLTMGMGRYNLGSCRDSRDWMRLGPCIT
jgi:hypothetical protein